MAVKDGSCSIIQFHPIQLCSYRVTHDLLCKLNTFVCRVLSPRPTTSSGYKLLIFVLNLRPNICKCFCLSTRSIPVGFVIIMIILMIIMIIMIIIVLIVMTEDFLWSSWATLYDLGFPQCRRNCFLQILGPILYMESHCVGKCDAPNWRPEASHFPTQPPLIRWNIFVKTIRNHHKCLVSSFRVIWIPMLWVLRPLYFVYSANAMQNLTSRRQILTSKVDPRVKRWTHQ